MKPNDVESIIRAEQELAKAHLTLDIGSIDALLHEDFTNGQPEGKIETKKDLLNSYRTGNRHWNRAEVDELVVKINGELAEVTGLWKAAGTNNGKSFDYQASFVSIWMKVNGTWKNLSYSSSMLSPK